MPIAEVAQADVDYWDGINLALLGQLIDLFEAGHQTDPTVPRLVSIALRSYFSPNKKAKPAPATKPTPEKPTGPVAPPADK
jgi:hypothetical protein